MSAVIRWRPSTTITKDPDAEKVYTFDWQRWLVGDAVIEDSDWVITGADDALEFDEDDFTDAQTSLRLTGGTIGVSYRLTNRITTNETPAQTDDKSITVIIAED